jgi:hypothetical protein
MVPACPAPSGPFKRKETGDRRFGGEYALAEIWDPTRTFPPAKSIPDVDATPDLEMNSTLGADGNSTGMRIGIVRV